MGKELQKVNADRQRQRFGKEFKLHAVGLLHTGLKPATQLALELGIRRNLLYKWAETLARHHGDTAAAFNGHGSGKLGKQHNPLKVENSRLKRELARMTEERDILKKAAAYFAQVPK